MKFVINYFKNISLISSKTFCSNEAQIQLLSEQLHCRLFKCLPQSNEVILRSHILNNLRQHGLDKRVLNKAEVTFTEFPAISENLSINTQQISNILAQSYRNLVKSFVSGNYKVSAKRPTKWNFVPGWTKYNISDGKFSSISSPSSAFLIFDVEVLLEFPKHPILAVAFDGVHWYSWCSDWLCDDSRIPLNPNIISQNYLIPLLQKGSSSSKLIAGHHVAFDRSFIREQYSIENSSLKFLDTLSLHVAVSGLTGFQKVIHRKQSRVREASEDDIGDDTSLIDEALAYKRGTLQYIGPPKKLWKDVGTLNGLVDIYKLYCGKKLSQKKEMREIFLTGKLTDVRDNFKLLMNYCAKDVSATSEVLMRLWPLFKERFPHPVTFAGMLEMSTSFLPINQNWNRYLNKSQSIVNEYSMKTSKQLIDLANNSLTLSKDERFRHDPWLFDLDWKMGSLRLSQRKIAKSNENSDKNTSNDNNNTEEKSDGDDNTSQLSDIISSSTCLPKNTRSSDEFPKWYRELCPKNLKDIDPTLGFGPTGLSTQVRVTPKLLRLTWNGFPLFFSKNHGWGYTVPAVYDQQSFDFVSLERKKRKKYEYYPDFPFKEIHKICSEYAIEEQENQLNGLQKYLPMLGDEKNMKDNRNDNNDDDSFESNQVAIEDFINTQRQLVAQQNGHTNNNNHHGKNGKKNHSSLVGSGRSSFLAKCKSYKPLHQGIGPIETVCIPRCWFFKLPHKDGPQNNVGNPLANYFRQFIEDGVLKAYNYDNAGGNNSSEKQTSYTDTNEINNKSVIDETFPTVQSSAEGKTA